MKKVLVPSISKWSDALFRCYWALKLQTRSYENSEPTINNLPVEAKYISNYLTYRDLGNYSLSSQLLWQEIFWNLLNLIYGIALMSFELTVALLCGCSWQNNGMWFLQKLLQNHKKCWWWNFIFKVVKMVCVHTCVRMNSNANILPYMCVCVCVSHTKTDSSMWESICTSQVLSFYHKIR